MNKESLEAALRQEDDDLTGLFRKASALGRYVLENGSDEGWLSQEIIRLYAAVLEDPTAEERLGSVASGLLREVGLFPYIQSERLEWRDRFAVESFRAPEELDLIFHRAQAHAFEELLKRSNVVLSAPTSFGKTLLVDAAIASLQPDVVVLVVPTLALLDEQRRRLYGRFSKRYQIITRVDQEIEPSKRTIFVLTQERLLERSDIENVDLFIIDEFYKLNGDPTNPRSKALNIAFHRYRDRAKQVFLLGPNVKARIPGDVFECVVIDSDAVTVATEFHDYRRAKPKLRVLHRLLEEASGHKSLIFCQSPVSARRLAQRLMADGLFRPSNSARRFAQWIMKNYHEDWVVPVALDRGIGIHHGSVPRSIGQRILTMFDRSDLDILICTSTLIEGVNTKAENIFIYDKKIENRNFDFFAYQNIKGRAGRFGNYLIGHVYLFDEPPEPEEYALDIPSLSPLGSVSDEFFIGFDAFSEAGEFERRRSAISSSVKLPPEIIAALATFQLEDIKAAGERVEAEVIRGNPLLFWMGRTEYKHLAATLDLTWKFFAKRSRLSSGNQAAFFAIRLLKSRGNIRRYLANLTFDKTEEALQRELDKAFRALRGIEFYVPSVLRANEVLINYFCSIYDLEAVEYQTMARMVESYFLPSNVKALEEYGVPTPIGIKLVDLFDSEDTLDEILRSIPSLRADELFRVKITSYEQELLRSAFE